MHAPTMADSSTTPTATATTATTTTTKAATKAAAKARWMADGKPKRAVLRPDTPTLLKDWLAASAFAKYGKACEGLLAEVDKTTDAANARAILRRSVRNALSKSVDAAQWLHRVMIHATDTDAKPRRALGWYTVVLDAWHAQRARQLKNTTWPPTVTERVVGLLKTLARDVHAARARANRHAANRLRTVVTHKAAATKARTASTAAVGATAGPTAGTTTTTTTA